jgi:hypothetical protein
MTDDILRNQLRQTPAPAQAHADAAHWANTRMGDE